MGSSTHGAHPAACDYGAGNKQDDNLIYHVFGLRTGAAEYDSPFLTRFLFVVLWPHPFARKTENSTCENQNEVCETGWYVTLGI